MANKSSVLVNGRQVFLSDRCQNARNIVQVMVGLDYSYDVPLTIWVIQINQLGKWLMIIRCWQMGATDCHLAIVRMTEFLQFLLKSSIQYCEWQMSRITTKFGSLCQ